MAALAILAGIGVFCWLLYSAAIYTLPFLVGAFVGLHAEQAGAGPLGGILTGMEIGRTAQRIGGVPPTSLGVGSSVHRLDVDYDRGAWVPLAGSPMAQKSHFPSRPLVMRSASCNPRAANIRT
jgi:hypothetical protein